MNGPSKNLRVAPSGSTANGVKVDPSNPQVRKLVYNAYREMLSKKHADANVIVDSAPQELVTKDQGIGSRLESMMRQQSELKGGNMNAGGPPPPPPPPPIPGIIPPSRLPSEIPTRPAMNTPPAALASAMMKDKKPFTYTPGGLDLSEISNQPNQNGDNVDQAPNSADFGPPTQSRSFKVLQTVLDSHDNTEPQGPIHIPSMRHVQPPSQYQPPPNQYQQQPVYQQQPPHNLQSGVNNDAEQAIPEPKKYMGGNIPSRSFRMLQAMTGSDDATDAGEPANTSESSGQPDDDTQHTANQISSPNSKSSITNSPSSSLSPLTQVESHDVSSDSGISSPSKIGSYTIGKDSKVYRHVSPKITFNTPKERVVNSALSNTRESSSPTWKVAPYQSLTNTNNHSSPNSPINARPVNVTREEPTSPVSQNPPPPVERRYEGGFIPSRVFRHLQTEYPSSDPSELQESKTPSPRFNGGAIPPRVLRSMQSEADASFESDVTDGENASRASSSLAELDEYYHNGMARTAVTKDTVLKELTSQFDQTGIRKKPKAAPGRVFRYLQAQYDPPEDSANQQQPVRDTLKPEQEGDASGFGYRGAKVPSPSFKFLQSHYTQEQDKQPSSQEHIYPDAPELKEEPLPYRGYRVPGRTFRSLQDNVTTHPSVLKPRK